MATATAGSSSPPTPHADDSPEPSLPGEKVYVAVGREVAESRATLLWALHRFPRGAGAGAASFVLLHVYSPPKLLPFRTSLALFSHFLFSAANANKGLPVYCCKRKGLFFRLQEMISLTVFSCQSYVAASICVIFTVRLSRPRLVRATLFHSTKESFMHEVVNEVNLQNLFRDGCNFS